MLVILSLHCSAETYKVIVGTPPGSGSDAQARRVFDLVSKDTGDTFIIINKPGGAFVVGYRAFLEESKNSSNVLLLTHASLMVTAYVTQPEQKLDPLTETKGLIAFQKIRHFIVARKDSNIQTEKDIKGKLNIGYSSLVAEPLFRTFFREGDFQFVAYKAENEIVQALLAKDVDLIASHSLNTALISNKDKLIKIAPYGINRDECIGYSVPPTMAESDRKRLNQAINKVLKRPEIVEWFLETTSLPPEGGTSEQYDAMMQQGRKNIQQYFNK